ncbi:lytic transglycosylase domain-containing protein [Microbacterium flavum]|uniref:Lytic transglycosylase domain-containing protein n=1 Tax=Microbacterium flavum TaxID=415216 RepID=A0ABS5XQ28_9MICO|nr:lytic transglycosylase domain-containing protein [Microbacterium flavum]MBT8796630.1 lytic transglycosylase domain-containing protein [Microbacterium flavum]
MPRFSLRSFTPAIVCAGLVVGMITTTGAALPHAASTSSSPASARAEAVSAPLAEIASQGRSALLDARAAIDEARQVTVDIRTSGLDIGASSTVVNTAPLGEVVEKLEALDVTPALLVPSLTAEASTATQTVREQAAMLRGRLDAAVAKKAEEEAAAKAAAEAAAAAAAQAAAEAAAAQAAAEAEAAAAAKAAEEQSSSSSSSSSSGGSSAPSVDVNVDPASAQGIGRSMAASSYGWGDDQFACLLSLWNRESGWRVNAANSSGAYGIPQALPGSKMASAGADWQTNPATQIAWGLGYIAGRYGSPCSAWDHSESNGWY